MEEPNVNKFPPSSQRRTNENLDLDTETTKTKTRTTKIIIVIAIGIIVVVAIIIVCLTIFLLKKKQKKNINEDDGSNLLQQQEEEQVLKPIFTFNNKVGDLRRITINQTSYETMTINGQISKFLVHRNTTYDIYFESEQNSEEKSKNFYTTKYIAVMNIVKECYSSKEENCEPQTYMDLSSTQNKTNLRRLPERDNLKDIPIPICFIEFTDNDAITSISCPESLSENKKYEMTLDFYFFRPAAIERPDTNNPLKSVIIENIPIDNGKITRERNFGICDTKNAYKTHCTTDMNTTIDLNNNVVSYDEIAFSNFSTDENNSYVKNKTTYLKDITNQTENFSKEKYKNRLNGIKEKLKPYLKKDVLFSESDFKNLYSIVKGNTTKEKASNKRNLNENFNGLDSHTKGESLFFKELNGVQIDFKLENNIGIGENEMRTSSNLFFDKSQNYLATKSQQSPINRLIEKLIILSKAGNNLANELYEPIKEKLDNITKDIKLTISSLNDMIVYDDLVSIFDSSLSIDKINELPSTIIKQSQNLYDSLRNELANITEINKYRNTLNTDINNFLSESHDLTNELLEKVKEFGEKLGSPKGKLTEIATYYLNHTVDSYYTIVSKAENVLKNYYINEAKLISNEVNSILTSFEEKIKISIKKELSIIENIKTNLENKNMTINLGNENDTKKVISNLNNSINTISDIISTYKNKINLGLGLKKNGYFLNENEIQYFQSSVNSTIEELYKNAEKFDNDGLIDKNFDKIMSNFRENFTKIKNYMNNKRDEIFFMDEDVLKNNKFTQNEKDTLFSKLKNLRSDAVNEINDENNNNIDHINAKINNFTSFRKKSLIQLINNVNILFSEPTLAKLSNLYNNTFENSFELIKKQINNNKQLSYQYLDYLNQVLSNDAEIVINIDPYFIYKLGQVLYTDPEHYTNITKLQNFIKNKKITQAYLKKYDYYSSSFDSSKDYINNQMYIDLSYEYKNLIIKLKSLLQLVKNNKFSDKYGDLTELTFIDDNIRIIDNLYTRLDKYFSESLYNNNYLVKFNTFKQDKIEEIQKIKQTLDEKNKLLRDKYTIADDKTKDFCAAYTQIATYTCKNGAVWNSEAGDENCVNLINYSNNHNQLITPSIKSENNFEKLQMEFENFFASLDQNINEYNNILTTLKNEITSLETNAINKEGQLSCLNKLNEHIKTVLNQKYGDNLVKDSYDFYLNITEKKLADFLNFTNEKWVESFEIVDSEIKKNKNKFINNIEGFVRMAYVYKGRLKGIINDYTNSIINQQKNEFNYTISYYYNYLYTLVNKTYQYVIGKIPTNRDGFNNILNYRKNQVIEKYNEIIQIIKNSENNAINENNQINLLDVSITDFFKVNNIIENKISEIQTNLETIALDILSDSTLVSKDPTQYSISALLYLENSENGKIIEELSDSINSVDFINLNIEKFKELIDNNIIFDQENLLSDVNSLISKLNLETLAEYQRMRDEYYDKLENEIKCYFTQESLVEKIESVYEKGINELDDNSRNKILLNVNEILEVFEKHIKDESERLQTTYSYNSNYETINQTIKNYKEEIFNKVKNEMVDLFENLNKRMYDEIYTNYLEEGLNGYVTEIKSVTSNNTKFKEYKTLGNSYKLGDDIDNIAEDLSNQYKNIGKEEIENIIRSNYYKALNLEDIQQLINDKIESAFTSYLFPALKKYAVLDINDTSYHSYDLSNDIKNNISLVIKENLIKIKDIMNTTKGENYDFQLDYYDEWEILDFSESVVKLVGKIGDEFERYILDEIYEEKKTFNSYFKNNINTNFNEMLNNFIPTFGEKFFERISEYNLNNRIDNLFNNYKYSFFQTFFYYLFILSRSQFSLLKDLKQKLIKINNVNLMIEQNEDIILRVLDNKIDNFIEVTGNYLVNKYISYMKQEESNLEFSKLSDNIKTLIKTNLDDDDSKDDIKNKYKDFLQIYLKNPLTEKYELYLKDKIKELIKLVDDSRESVFSRIKDVEVVDSEEIFNEINEKINSTLEQIDNYNNHFNQFKISENLKQFLFSYGDKSVNPLFENIISLINNATKDIILKNLNANSDNYKQKLDINLFNNKINEAMSFLNKSYINLISNQINLYDSENYVIKLENEKDKIASRRRRYLENSNTEDDIKEEYSERVADKPLDDTFSKLLDTADSVQNYVDSLSEFNNYDKLINNYISDINIAVKKSNSLINMYNFEPEIMEKLNDKLLYLKNISLTYYYNVNDSYSMVRNHIKNSIKKINDGLKKCANITYGTFANNYVAILNNETYNSINTSFSANQESLNPIDYELTTQNGKIFFEAKIENFEYYSGFNFDVQYEEKKNIKKPKLSASIKNGNRPKKMVFKTYSKNGICGRKGVRIEIEFNNANYSTNLNFDTKSTNIKLTTNTKFDKYSYNLVPFEVENVIEQTCEPILGEEECYSHCPIKYEKDDSSEKQLIIVDAKEINNDTEILIY